VPLCESDMPNMQRGEIQKKKKEMSRGDMLDVLLFFSRLSGPRLEPNSPPSQLNPKDVSRRKVERWFQRD
jgi:hypothetical protein